MAEIILYLTKTDALSIVHWINCEKDIAWIVKDSQKGTLYKWKAVDSISTIEEGDYCLWKIGAGPLRIPSGSLEAEDTEILDPFNGWEQALDDKSASVPWFGAAAPETFGFSFKERGKESEGSLGRSGFNWIGNYFGIISHGAPKASEQWWDRLKRHIKKNSTGIPWSREPGNGKVGAYAYPEAYEQIKSGRPKDVNP